MKRANSSGEQMSHRERLVATMSILFVLLTPAVMAQSGEQASSQEYTPEGATTCLFCHDSPSVSNILQTPHAQKADSRTPFASKECESCHGPSADHVSSLASPGVVFGGKTKQFPASDVETQDQVCLACHESGLLMNWHGSQHQFADSACVSCHKIHSLEDPVLVAETQQQVCFTCHKDIRAAVNKASHMPINQGTVACTDCHNPHGSFGETLLVKNTVNETCYQCHGEKRGPFLWEHLPVREDCTNCHDPHGSTQPSLLKVRTPYLCQQCHSEPFHPSTLYSATGIPPTGGAQQLIGKACLNCHSKVHGSNHPSGARFQR